MTEAVLAAVDGLSADELPAFVYDLAALRRHAEAVRAALPERVELYYAAKANPEERLLSALRGSVDGYEVSSGGELTHVGRAVPGAAMAFGGPGKTPAEIVLASGMGVARWHVESEQELRLLAGAAVEPVDILLRVNLAAAGGGSGLVALDAAALDVATLDSVPLAMGGRPSPFGMDPAGVEACIKLLAQPGFERLRLRGIHAHLASGLQASDHLAVARSILDWSSALAERHGFALDEVNIGGGMAVDYSDPTALFDWSGYGSGLSTLLDQHPGLTLRIEPGRALTAYCGWYVTEVLDVKTSHGEAFALLRGGTHHLRTPAARNHSQPFTIRPVDTWPHPWQRPTAKDSRVTLCGQLCTPKDVLAHNAPVDTLRVGDRVAFAMAGAYGWNISHHEFLMHPRPVVRFLD